MERAVDETLAKVVPLVTCRLCANGKDGGVSSPTVKAVIVICRILLLSMIAHLFHKTREHSQRGVMIIKLTVIRGNQ
jgi:hypothetical protein